MKKILISIAAIVSLTSCTDMDYYGSMVIERTNEGNFVGRDTVSLAANRYKLNAGESVDLINYKGQFITVKRIK